jgi:hypothetical protein
LMQIDRISKFGAPPKKYGQVSLSEGKPDLLSTEARCAE